MRRHKPVLYDEVLERIPAWARVIMDGTLGHWGHTQWMLQAWYDVVGVDRDYKMIAKAIAFLDQSATEQEQDSWWAKPWWLNIVQTSYADFDTIVSQSWVARFDYILIDIGVNMDHFKEADGWFSIKLDGDLDMRYDTTTGEPVSRWLAKATYQDIVSNLTAYADFSEKYTDRIAKELIAYKKWHPFQTTQDVRYRAKDRGINDKKLAVIFQSWRIQVNDELGELDRFLEGFYTYLKPWGRCVVLTYHSGEDRRVKNVFKSLEKQKIWTILTKHVIKPHWKEVERNKAARSAKMRVFELPKN